MCDGVFEEEMDTMSVEDKEWRQLKQARARDGYRDGISEGEDQRLQKGFNDGYRESVTLNFQLAKLRGTLSALIGHNMTVGEGIVQTSNIPRLESLMQEVVQLETDMAVKQASTENITKDSKENLDQTVEHVDTTADTCDKESECCGGRCTSDSERKLEEKNTTVIQKDFDQRLSDVTSTCEEILKELVLPVQPFDKT